MFFEDHEKQIYSPPESDQKFDPLALDRTLALLSQGRLAELVGQWQPAEDGEGDVGKGAKARDALMRAEAEVELTRIARKAFGVPDFPAKLDAHALEMLCDFLRWMEKKGQRGETPQSSPSTSEVPAT